MKSNAVLDSNVKLLNAVKYVFFFALFYIFAKAGINNLIFVFGFGLFFSLVWCNQNILIIAPMYVLTTYLATFSTIQTICAGATAVFLILVYGVHYKLRKPIKPYLYIIYALLSQAGTVFFEIYYGANIVLTAIGLVIGMLATVALMHFFSAIFVKGFSHKMTLLEILCGACFLMIFACGLTSLEFYGIELIKIVACYIILCSTYCFNAGTTTILAGVLGIGSMLTQNNPYFIAPLLILAFSVSIFKVRNKFIPSIVMVAVDVCLGIGFKLYYSYSYINLISILIPVLLFLIIPEKIYSGIRTLLEMKDQHAMRNIVNRSRENLCRRFNELSEVFGEMDIVFRSLVKNGLNTEDAKKMITYEIKEKVCADCKEKNRCHRQFATETDGIFGDMVSSSLERGKTTLLDIPPFLTARCKRLNSLVGSINGLCDQYKNYAGIMNNLDTSKVLIAEQLGGVAKIMKSLSKEVGNNVTFDTEKEEKIISECEYYDILCNDVVIYEQSTDVVSATVIVQEKDARDERIPKIVSKICENKMQVSSISPSLRSGWSNLTLTTASKYDIIFGASQSKKATSKVSGDCYSLIRIESDKFLLAVCDGMGSGEKAQKASNLAIGLVENFYKAGFDNDIILSSVNKLLTLTKDDTYSALDMCIIDLRKGVSDFIKLASPISFIKHNEMTTIVESGSLPLGIVQEIKPMVKKQVLTSGDLIILCSDGIVDSFSSEDEMQIFINNIKETNPQSVADIILERAKDNYCDVPKDDMTVLVAKIFSSY